jgi:hypothetical protein
LFKFNSTEVKKEPCQKAGFFNPNNPKNKYFNTATVIILGIDGIEHRVGTANDCSNWKHMPSMHPI